MINTTQDQALETHKDSIISDSNVENPHPLISTEQGIKNRFDGL
jgi:hypothetical protein